MTMEEAIEQLQNCKGLILQDGKDWLDERDIPLIDMAISALQRQDKMIRDIENFILYGEEKTETKIAVEDFLNAPVINITESPNEVVEKNDEVIDHDREWIIGCIKHDGFIKTDRFDKANQIILEALEQTEPSDLISRHEALMELNGACEMWEDEAIVADILHHLPSVSAERVIRCKDCKWWSGSANTSHNNHLCKRALDQNVEYWTRGDDFCSYGVAKMKSGAE